MTKSYIPNIDRGSADDQRRYAFHRWGFGSLSKSQMLHGAGILTYIWELNMQAPSSTMVRIWECQLIGLREILQENPMIFMGTSGWFPVDVPFFVNLLRVVKGPVTI